MQANVNIPAEDRAALERLASSHLRGVALSDLVTIFQDAQDDLEYWGDIDVYNLTTGPPTEFYGFPSEYSREEYRQRTLIFTNALFAAIRGEIDRREHIVMSPVFNNDPHILRTIKEKIGEAGMLDIMEQFAEVIIHKSAWQFRCKQHGDGHDKTPSGHIYQKELRWWCFACNKGGDIYDFVEIYGKRSKREAIEYCARWVGIDLNPIIPVPLPKFSGGAEL